MSKIRYIHFWSDDWLAGTGELSAADRGIYITICALIWSRGEGDSINDELLKRHCQEHGNAINAALTRLEKAGKIVRKGSEIVQKRAGKELENARKRSRNLSENGAEGNKIRWDSDRPAMDDSRAQVPKIKTSTKESSNEDSDSRASAAERSRRELAKEFDDIWRLFPRKRDRGHALKAFIAARKSTALETIVAGIKRFAAEASTKDPQFIPYPGSWLNGQGWLDYQEATVADPKPAGPRRASDASRAQAEAFLREHGLSLPEPKPPRNAGSAAPQGGDFVLH